MGRVGATGKSAAKLKYPLKCPRVDPATLKKIPVPNRPFVARLEKVRVDKMLPAYDFVIADDEVIAVGDVRLRTIHNPGHTPGSA